MTAIAVSEVHKRYGRGARAVDALRGVSLTVPAGEIYGLLGRNGAGKTTLVKVLLDLVRPSRGETTLLGQPSKHPTARQQVGYLPEDHRFPDYQTAESAMVFYGALSGLSASDSRRQAGALLETVNLGHAARKKVRTFSKGMKQRLGLAQALIHDPQLLFLDEPTDGVDPVGRAEIREVLVDLKARGKTIFLNSHLLSEVEQVCDRVGILDDGALVREGSIEQLTSTELVYAVQTSPAPTTDVIQRLRELSVTLDQTADAGFEIGLTSEKDIDRVVDLLRSAGVGVRHLQCKKLSLEQVFLESLQENGGDQS